MVTDEKLDLILSKLVEFESRFDKIDAKFEKIDAKFEEIDARFDKIDAKFEEIDARFEAIETDISSIKCTIENEIDKNIKVIAESHINNNFHTQQAEGIANNVRYSQELQNIRLNIIENNINQLKKAVGID